jgi:hypothetical protein
MPAELARLSRFADVRPARPASAARWRSFIGWSSSAQARWLISVSIASPSSSPAATSSMLTPRRFMPVSTITSHGSPPASRQRATWANVLSTGRAKPCRANGMSAARAPCSTDNVTPETASAAASAQVATKKSRQPAPASRRQTSTAPSP